MEREKATAVRKENQNLIKTLVRDVRSLVEHGAFLNGKSVKHNYRQI